MEFLTIRRVVDWLTLGGYAAALALGVGYGAAANRFPAAAEDRVPLGADPAGWKQAAPPEARAWEVFIDGAGPADAPADDPARRYRLAGTFFLEDDTAGSIRHRQAVLDDRETGRQSLVSEGDRVGDYLVALVEPLRVVLRQGAAESVLTLQFAGPPETAAAAPAAPAAPEPPAWDERVLEENRFGKRISDSRWVMHRSELLQYRQELLDDPERLAKLFLSMKPDRTGDKIEGYRLDPEGESEFYAAIGLQEGDIVRKTNSMKMTNRRRAEYFIREFVNDRLNVVVLDVERDNEPMKLIYYIR